MPISKTAKFSLAVCTAARILFVFGVVPDGISGLAKTQSLTSALVNPLHTFKHLREGHFLLQLSGGSFENAYTGYSFRCPPLLLAAFQPLLSVQPRAMQDILTGLLITLIELGVALCLYEVSQRCLQMSSCNDPDEKRIELDMNERIWPRRAWVFGIKASSEGKEGVNGHDRTDAASSLQSCPNSVFDLSVIPQMCCLFYYANPLTILASVGTNDQSFQSVFYLLLLLALREVVPPIERAEQQGASQSKVISIPLSTFYLSFAAYAEIYPFVYLIPVSLLAGNTLGNTEQAMKSCIAYFLLWSCLLHTLSTILVGSDWVNIQRKIYGDTYCFANLSPNLGMHWYFSVQMFDRFRRYFVVLLNGLPYIFVIPLSIRIHKYPIPLATSLFSLGAIFKPVLTCHDMSMMLALFLMSPRTLARMGNASLVSVFALIVPISLFAMDYWLWLETGSGNANYMYFQCLAFCTFLGILTLDFVSATVKRDKAIRLTMKQEQGGGQ